MSNGGSARAMKMGWYSWKSWRWLHAGQTSAPLEEQQPALPLRPTVVAGVNRASIS